MAVFRRKESIRKMQLTPAEVGIYAKAELRTEWERYVTTPPISLLHFPCRTLIYDIDNDSPQQFINEYVATIDEFTEPITMSDVLSCGKKTKKKP